VGVETEKFTPRKVIEAAAEKLSDADRDVESERAAGERESKSVRE